MSELMFSKSSFVKEGSFFAVPICFPNVSAPLKPEDSYIESLCLAPNGQAVYGATSGEQCHFIGAALKSDQGYVIDLGIVEHMSQVVSICTDKENLYGCFNGNGNACIAGIKSKMGHTLGTSNGIQEWNFIQYAIQTLCEFSNETILHAEFWLETEQMILLTSKRLLVYHLETGVIRDFEPEQQLTQLFSNNDARFFVLDASNTIHEFFPEQMTLKPLPLHTPHLAEIDKIAPVNAEKILLTTIHGAIYQLDLGQMKITHLSSVPVSPVKTLTAVANRYCYVFYGEGIGRFGRFNLDDGGFKDLGCVVSALSTKRYGYDFACSTVGRDGEIYLGEYDRGGHLWVYYPSLSLYL